MADGKRRLDALRAEALTISTASGRGLAAQRGERGRVRGNLAVLIAAVGAVGSALLLLLLGLYLRRAVLRPVHRVALAARRARRRSPRCSRARRGPR